MSFISEIIRVGEVVWQMPQIQIRVQLFSDPISSEEVVRNLALIGGPIDIYCWYEGTQGLPKRGAQFMKEEILEPLFSLKKDVKLYLYSLRAWDFKNNINNMCISTTLGEAINRIHQTAIECLYSSSFFRYCAQVSTDSPLYAFFNQELIKKKELIKLSAHERIIGCKVAALFDHHHSLFDCIKEWDVASAYSLMQYVEGYYLIRESVKKGLLKGQKKINVAFVLPNDEGKYYVDLPKEIEKMLQLDFGSTLIGIDIHIIFQFFRYGDSLKARPYIDKTYRAPKVEAKEMSSYFSYLSGASIPREPFLRDVIHNLNKEY